MAIIAHRRWVILLPFALGLFAVPYIGKRVPAVFKSETLIMVIPQRVPDSYVKPTVTATVSDRLPTISDQILSRSRLERIINDFGLYKDLRARAPLEDVVRRMRSDIGPVQIQAGAQSFRVSYSSYDPRVAQKVAGRLASLFIDENSRDRENLAESTNVFIESQLEDTKGRLLEHERKLEVYRRLHAGELPSQVDSNLRAIQTAQVTLQSVSESANRASEHRLLVERQLIDAQSTPEVTLPVVGTGSPDTQLPLSTAQQLEVAERRLEAMRLRYTAEHPEVKGMERTINELRLRAAEEAKRPKPLVEKVVSPIEQARLKRIRDLQADLEVTDHQLSGWRAEGARLKALIAEYQEKVDAAPKRESELVELTRDYDTLKKSYDSLVVKREDSNLAANLERRQIGEQFRILDLASLPVKPSNAVQRMGLSFSGAVLGLMLGVLIAAVIEFRNSSFSREDEVTRLLSLPVLALVPVMISVPERQRAKRLSLSMDVAGAMVLFSSVAFVAWGFLGR